MNELESSMERVTLLPITDEDTEDIVRWRNSDIVRSRFIYRDTFTAEGHRRWMEDMVKTGKVVQFIIRENESKKKIGSVYLRDIDQKNKKCEFGIFIGEEEFLGKGYGTLAAKKILSYGFEELGMNKIFLRVLADNRRAYNSYLAAGFVEEGVFRQDVWIDGKPVDVIFMAKFSCEKK